MNFKDILVALGITTLMILGSIEKEIPTEVPEPTEDIVRWEQEERTETHEEHTETHVEPLEVEVVTEPTLISLGEFRLTAYCSCEKCCGVYAQNRPTDDYGNELVLGASGMLLEAGRSIAVDPDVIPYGTVVIIDGQEYIASDCGGAIKENRIDIYMGDSHSDALDFGVQYAEVFIKGGE